MEVTGQEARFRAMFAEEAEGRLAALSELLLELEGNGDDRELLSSVFREAHTLKGAAAVVGMADVLRVAHAMEEVLEGLRRGDGAATPALVDALLGAVDGMRELVPAALSGDDRADQADRLVGALHDPPPGPEPSPPPEAPAAQPPSDPAPAGRGRAPAPGGGRRDTIRLPVQRLDELVRLVGEASAAALRVGRLVTDELGVEPAGVPELHDLTRVLESLQERTLQARMVPFATVAEPLRRAGRDLARSLGKAVDLELRGQDTELDRGVLERIADPLLHLVRNAIDHGIEPPEARLSAGKPPPGHGQGPRDPARLRGGGDGGRRRPRHRPCPGPPARRRGRGHARRRRRRRGHLRDLPLRAVDGGGGVGGVGPGGSASTSSGPAWPRCGAGSRCKRSRRPATARRWWWPA